MTLRRQWADARAKVDEATGCRVCGRGGRLEAAHVIGRARDERVDGGVVYVHPDSIVPLCASCHRDYDSRTLDLEPHLTAKEAARAVLDAGSIEAARRRINGWRAALEDTRQAIVAAVGTCPCQPSGQTCDHCHPLLMARIELDRVLATNQKEEPHAG